MDEGLRLLGFDPGVAGPLRPGDRATLSLWWQTQRQLSKELALIISISQGDKAWVLSKPQLLGGTSYSTIDWPRGVVVRTFVDLRLPPDVLAGEYALGLRLSDAESGMPLSADWHFGKLQVTGRTRSFEVPPLANASQADFGERMTLLGFDLDLSQAAVEDGMIRLTLYWQAQSEMETAYKVFVHLLDDADQIIAQVDREPQGGNAPTTGWLSGEVVIDRIELATTEAMFATQSIAIGLYDPLTGERVPVLNTDGSVVSDNVMLDLH
jgi:hypothetical protein